MRSKSVGAVMAQWRRLFEADPTGHAANSPEKGRQFGPRRLPCLTTMPTHGTTSVIRAGDFA
jgi:hypothetical protein